MNISIINNGDSGFTARTIINQVITALNTANVSASFVTGSNVYGPYGSNSILSSSYSLTASFLIPGTYAVTSSWSNNSSQALTASFLPIGTYQITASQALTASFLPVNTYNITSSWAVSSSRAVTASYMANAVVNASVPNRFNITFTKNDNSTFNITNKDVVVELPQLGLRVRKFDPVKRTNPLGIYYLPTQTGDWKSYSPQLWLFRLIPKRRKKAYDAIMGQYYHKFRPSHWAHPTPSNVSRDPIFIQYNSQHKIYAGAPENTLYSEWNIGGGIQPYDDITPFNFDIMQFYSIDGVTPVSGSFPYDKAPIPTARRRSEGSGLARPATTLFTFKVVIRDPYNPSYVIMGPPSPILKACPINGVQAAATGCIGIALSQYISHGL